MKEKNLIELYILKNRLIKKGLVESDDMCQILEAIDYKEKLILEEEEETSATGGPAVSGGMGAVVSAQPSGLAGQTIGTSWASGGGTVGSGDVSVPYNPSGANRVFQKIQSPTMGKDHGARTGKKSRVKKLDLKALKDVFAKRQDFTSGEGDREQGIKGKGKVMSFNNFLKNDFTTIKKESLNESNGNDIVMVYQIDGRIITASYGTPVIAFQKDVDDNKLTLRDGYFGGTAIIGSESSEDKGSVDFSSPFHKDQVLHNDGDDMVEELDFKFHNHISKSIIREYLDKYVIQNYNPGFKIVKIYYH